MILLLFICMIGDIFHINGEETSVDITGTF